jgi:DnaK suppressor protein
VAQKSSKKSRPAGKKKASARPPSARRTAAPKTKPAAATKSKPKAPGAKAANKSAPKRPAAAPQRSRPAKVAPKSKAPAAPAKPAAARVVAPPAQPVAPPAQPAKRAKSAPAPPAPAVAPPPAPAAPPARAAAPKPEPAPKVHRVAVRPEPPAAPPPPAEPLDLDSHRARLQAKKREIEAMYLNDLRSGQESNDSPTEDLVDRANNAYSRELSFSISDAERNLLLQVEEAIARIDGGRFGRCTHCGHSIARPRLEAIPWARLCINCQELLEQGLLPEG